MRDISPFVRLDNYNVYHECGFRKDDLFSFNLLIIDFFWIFYIVCGANLEFYLVGIKQAKNFL